MRSRTAGFTLIEVLLATVLLAAGLTLAFATLGAATGAARHGEEIAQRNEHMRAVQGFLRRRLASARAVPFATDSTSGLSMRFAGDAGRMRFVSDLPDYIGRGGPQVHDLGIERMPSGDGLRLVLGLSGLPQSGANPEVPGRDPEVLAENLREARFRYRALGPESRLTDWQTDWTAYEQLPLLVEIQLVDADGRAWPPLVVQPRLAGGHAGGGAL
jgi:general secretion pathway protein J